MNSVRVKDHNFSFHSSKSFQILYFCHQQKISGQSFNLLLSRIYSNAWNGFPESFPSFQ